MIAGTIEHFLVDLASGARTTSGLLPLLEVLRETSFEMGPGDIGRSAHLPGRAHQRGQDQSRCHGLARPPRHARHSRNADGPHAGPRPAASSAPSAGQPTNNLPVTVERIRHEQARRRLIRRTGQSPLVQASPFFHIRGNPVGKPRAIGRCRHGAGQLPGTNLLESTIRRDVGW